MTEITIDVDDTAITAALDRIAALLTDMTPLMNDLGEYLVRSTKERFAAGQAPDGTPWAPKSQVTIDRQYGKGANRIDIRPLFGESRALSSQIHYQVGSDSVEWGSNLIYAAVQQFGAKKGEFGAAMGRTKPSEKRPWSQDYFFPLPWGDIPARPFLGVSDDDRDQILATVDEWLLRAVQAGA